jgi:hypothetical protein
MISVNLMKHLQYSHRTDFKAVSAYARFTITQMPTEIVPFHMKPICITVCPFAWDEVTFFTGKAARTASLI